VPATLRELERRAEAELPLGFESVVLSPVAPLGAVAALTSVDQNSVLATTRGNEVVSDPTNVLALECALRRRALLAATRGSSERVRLAATHRTLRAQVWNDPRFSPHFSLMGLCTAGRDEGAFRFELETLLEHARFYLRVPSGLGDLGLPVRGLHAAFTPIGRVRRRVGTGRRRLHRLDAAAARQSQGAATDQRSRARAPGRRTRRSPLLAIKR
jgi:hypothetical protein